MREQSLATLQKQFKSLLQRRATRKELLAIGVKDSEHFSSQKRFEIYHYAVNSRIKDAIAEDFPLVEKHIGKKLFQKLLTEFLIKRPSQYTNLGEVSQGLPQFIKSKRAINFPYLYDLARFEWAKVISDLSPEEENNFENINTITEKDFDSAKLVLSSSVQLLKSKWSLHLPSVQNKITHLVIYQNDDETNVEELTQSQFLVLKSISNGVSLKDVLKTLAHNQASVATASSFFSSLVRKSIIVGFKKGVQR